MGHDNITKLASLLVKLHKAPSGWLCLHPRPERSSTCGGVNQRRIKLVRSDGSSELYNHPVVVSELIRDFPEHKICRSDSLYIGQKTPVLSETDTLKPGLNYFLLPSEFFQNDLSFLTIAALKSPQNGGVLVRKSAGTQQQPFLIQKGDTGGRLRIRVSEDFISELMMEGRKNREKEEKEEEEEEGEGKREGRLCTTVKLKKDYLQLVGLRKWKPKLETITETKAMKATREKKKKRKKFPVMKKRSSKDSSQTDSCPKRKLQSKFKSKTKKAILRK